MNSQIAKQKDELARVREELREVLLLKDKTDELRAEILNSEEELEELESDIQNKEDESRNLSERIDDAKSSMSLYLETGYLLDAGFYEEPKYLYETSDRYKTEIQLIRAEIKNMISENRAIIIPDSIVAIDDSALSKKVLQGQAKLMLKTFNIEVDLLLLNLKTSNFAKTVERIEKIATEVEKCVVSLKCGFNEEYVRLRLKECELQYQFKLKQQEEQEEQRAIKEQMAEEQKAIRDFERAIAKAKKDEQMYEDADRKSVV